MAHIFSKLCLWKNLDFSDGAFRQDFLLRALQPENFLVYHNLRILRYVAASRNPISTGVVEAKAESHAARGGERHVVPGEVNFLESIVSLEVGQAVALRSAVEEVAVPEAWDSSLGAGPNSLSDKGIGGSLSRC